MCAYGKRAAAGFESANVARRLTSTVTEDNCLKRIQTTHFFCLWGEEKRRLRKPFPY